MGYRFNRLDEPVLMAVSKPMLTEFGIHHRLESCVVSYTMKCISSVLDKIKMCESDHTCLSDLSEIMTKPITQPLAAVTQLTSEQF